MGLPNDKIEPSSSVFRPYYTPVVFPSCYGAKCPVIWLMNQTSTKAIDGMTPYEAAFFKEA
jgi:hypothetical protein